MGGRRLLLWFIQLYIFNHPLPLAETFFIGGGGGGGGGGLNPLGKKLPPQYIEPC